MVNLYYILKQRAINLWTSKGLFLTEKVIIKARPLSSEEAIGNPEDNDFPLQKGKERLMQAEFRDGIGQAFTDSYGDFEGTLEEILNMPLSNNFRRAIFVATLNAVLRHTGHVTKTIHCKNQEPAQCANKLLETLQHRFKHIKIAQIGFQPRIVQTLSKEFPLRVLDMDTDNIGKKKFGVSIEETEHYDDAINWADLLLVTGTTLVNNTIENFLNKKPIIFFGTTIAAAAKLMDWERFCANSR